MTTSWRNKLALLVVCLSPLGAPAPAGAQSVAMATDVAGKVISGGHSLSILTEIPADARVELAAGARLVAIYLKAGDEYSFAGPAQIQFRADEPQVLSGARPQKRANLLSKGGKDITIKPIGIAQAGFVMRGGGTTARIKLFTLSGTKTLDTAPEFRWQEVEPGAQYRFELTDDTGKSLYDTTLGGSSLTLPASVQLREGVNYTWELSARLADGRRYVSAGDFSLAAGDLRARVASLRPAPNAPVSDRVAFAAWLEQMELKDEARQYWKALSSERPDDAKLKSLAAD